MVINTVLPNVQAAFRSHCTLPDFDTGLRVAPAVEVFQGVGWGEGVGLRCPRPGIPSHRLKIDSGVPLGIAFVNMLEHSRALGFE